MKTTQKGSLAVSALTKFLVGVVAVAALLFAPAGSLGYVGAWRLLAVLFIPMIIFGLVALIFSPDLLARRLKSKEERTTQSGVVRLSGLLFVVGFVVAGLDYRFGWSNVSQTTIGIACGVFIVDYLLYAEVRRENVWLSRTIEVSEGQRALWRCAPPDVPSHSADVSCDAFGAGIVVGRGAIRGLCTCDCGACT